MNQDKKSANNQYNKDITYKEDIEEIFFRMRKKISDLYASKNTETEKYTHDIFAKEIQKQLYVYKEVGRTTVTGYLQSGTTPIPTPVIIAISKIFGVSYNFLFGESDTCIEELNGTKLSIDSVNVLRKIAEDDMLYKITDVFIKTNLEGVVEKLKSLILYYLISQHISEIDNNYDQIIKESIAENFNAFLSAQINENLDTYKKMLDKESTINILDEVIKSFDTQSKDFSHYAQSLTIVKRKLKSPNYDIKNLKKIINDSYKNYELKRNKESNKS